MSDKLPPSDSPRLAESGDLPDGTARRDFLTTAGGIVMAAGLAGAYGTFGAMLGQFVYPASGPEREWMFVCTLDAIPPGKSLDYESATGIRIVVARQGDGTSEQDFLALSSVCPHLGCRVHWESVNDRFFCPCHNGAFDRQGHPVSGPPQAAGQSLMRYPLKVENGLLFLEVPVERLIASDGSETGQQGDRGRSCRPGQESAHNRSEGAA